MEKLIKNKYNEERPLITIRSNLPNEINEFVKILKRLNKGSQWINEAIIEKYNREKNEKIPQANITEINTKKEESINQIKLAINNLEFLDKQEKDYRERKKIQNLKQNKKRKEKIDMIKKENKNNKYF